MSQQPMNDDELLHAERTPPKHDENTAHTTLTATSSTTTPQHEQQQQQQQHHVYHPPPQQLPRYYPHWPRTGQPVYYGNPEALGWVLDAIGRAISFVAAGAFLGTSLLRLAKLEVGCPVDPAPGETTVPECHERVYGLFKPSSLLTTYTVVVGVASALFLPVMGAVVDYSPHRRLVGRWLSFWVCILLLPQIFLTENTWFAIAMLQILVAFVGWAQSMITHAYLPELSNDQERVTVLTQSFTIASFGSMVAFLIVVIAIATTLDLGDIDTARVGMATAFVACCITLYPAWAYLLQKRPAMRDIPAGRSLWTAGFVQVWQSSKYIHQNWSALQWFYINVTLVDGAVSSLGTIMITYLTDTLLFSSTENGIAILLLLLGSIPGAMIAGKTSRGSAAASSLETSNAKSWFRGMDPIKSSLGAALMLAANSIVAAVVLKEPGQQLETYILALIWGAGTGWKWTTDRLLISTILPCTGQEAELMGLYLFCGQAFSWLPPLVYTLLNEAGVDQRIGIGSISTFFLLGAVAVVLMGKYDDAVALAGRVNVTTTTSSTATSSSSPSSPAAATIPAGSSISSSSPPSSPEPEKLQQRDEPDDDELGPPPGDQQDEEIGIALSPSSASSTTPSIPNPESGLSTYTA